MTLKIIVISSISITCFLIALYWLNKGIRSILARCFWKGTSAVIKIIDISEEYDSEWGTTYYPKIVYEYIVQGKTFTGTRVIFSESQGLSNIVIEDWSIKKWNIGRNIRIKYHPSKFNESVIFAGVPPGFNSGFFGSILGLILFSVGAIYEYAKL